jgi:GNAT superfamily N-acetyltransferase
MSDRRSGVTAKSGHKTAHLAGDNGPVSDLEVRPASADRWTDLAELFDNKGDAAACSCMWFRVHPKTFSASGKAGNRAAMATRVAAGEEPGLIAYDSDRPVGWVSVAPRRDFVRIETPPAPGRGEMREEGVWAVVCFFIAPGQRKKGIASALLASAIEYARDHGARVLEAYPIDRFSPISNSDAYTGVVSMYARAGFREVGRFDRWAAIPDASGPAPKRLVRPPGRPVMRLEL